MKIYTGSVRRFGVTLTEIVVVIAIISILATLTFFMFNSSRRVMARYDDMARTARNHVARSQTNTPAPPALPPVSGGIAGHSAPLIIPPTVDDPPAPVVVPLAARDNGDYGYAPEQVLIAFAPTVKDPVAEAARLARDYDGKVLKLITRPIRLVNLRVADDKLEALKADPAVGMIERNLRGRIMQQTTPTGVRRINSFPSLPANNLVLKKTPPKSSDRNLRFRPGANVGNPPIHVAVIDSGVDATHPDLNVYDAVGFAGYPPIDENGHGTHVAGIIGARGNSQGVIGVYPGAPIWSQRITSAAGFYFNIDLLFALLYVYDHSDKIRVCNMSIGGGVSPIVNSFVDAVSDFGHVVMVPAAGNSSIPASLFTPASASKAICVAAMGDSDGRPGAKGPNTGDGPDDTFATFSNFGPTVALIAPGVDIYSTEPGNSYGYKQGTSMAAPHVAGTIALLLDPNTQFGTSNRNLFRVQRPTVSQITAPYLRSIATEWVPGIAGDPLSYPMINFKVLN